MPSTAPDTSRGPYVWRRIRDRQQGPNQGYLLLDERGEAEAYIYLRTEREPTGFMQILTVADRAARSPRGWRALWSFLADHGTMVSEIHLETAPTDPLALLLAEQPALQLQLLERFMTRVVNIPQALTCRGYPVGLNTQVQIQVHDPLIPEMGGRFTLEIADGRTQVVPSAAEPSVRCGPRGFAAIYSGYIAPQVAADAGLVQGSPEALARLAGIFTCAPAWSPDRF